MGEAPRAECRPVQKALVKRVSRSETSTSGSLTSRHSDPTKLRAAGAGPAVAVFKARRWQSLRSGPAMRARSEGRCAPAKSRGRSGRLELEEVKADAPTATRGHGERVQQAGRRQVVGLDALRCPAAPDPSLPQSRRCPAPDLNTPIAAAAPRRRCFGFRV